MFIKIILNKPYKHIIRGANKLKKYKNSIIAILLSLILIIFVWHKFLVSRKYSNIYFTATRNLHILKKSTRYRK